ncbi:hypothetical protein D5R40_30915 [Okeania hirsuta]|uniref:Uncharacterized protein n=1 Tax=Okeania hirsuta TaxID=1458930 RepID=A0A3N6R6A0_9CYAN|nr:hypothetical protein D5R40_30915 [Okeania hirsuta]
MRYQIAQDRFLINKLSITDLSIALQEKDQANEITFNRFGTTGRAIIEFAELTLFDFTYKSAHNALKI